MRAGRADIPGGAGAHPRGRGRARRIAARGAVALVSVVFAAAVVGVVLAGRSPGWWRGIDAGDPSLATAGADLENAVVNEMSRVRPGGAGSEPGAWRSDEWTFEVRSEDATAWLSTRLNKWLVNRADGSALPERVRHMEVSFTEGEARIGADVAVGEGRRVISVRGRPYIGADGGLWIGGAGFYAGRLPVPASWIAGVVGPEGAIGDGAVSDVLSGGAPLARTPSVALGDGRVVRVVGITVLEGRMVVTCRTERG